MKSSALLPVLVPALLLVAASRLLRLDDLTMNMDEVWSIWQTFGSFGDILRRTPYDWPPLYFLTLGAWSQLAGIQPLALRALSALAFLPGAAIAFRLLDHWRGWRAGLLALLVWSGLGMAVQLSMEVRGYALQLPLTMLALWMAVRHFERPGWRRALPLTLTMAALFWLSYTGGMVIFLTIAFGLLVYRPRLRSWLLPGLLTGLLVLPELLRISELLVRRVDNTSRISLPPVLSAIVELYIDFLGSAWPVTASLAAAALWLVLRRGRHRKVLTLALAFHALGMPLLMYLLNHVLGLFHGRYAWWIMPGIALLIAFGLSWLPRRGTNMASILLAAVLFAPVPDESPYQIFDRLSPLEDNFRWLRDQMQWGDELLVAPDVRNSCGAAEEWVYQRRAWLPNGLEFISEPAGQPRIWVLNPDFQSPELRAHLEQERIPGRFVGPYGCLFRLYEAPPDPAGIPYANGMRFHGAELLPGSWPASDRPLLHEGDTFQFRLWWSVDEAPTLDYSLHTW
ncbi:MAG: glycosyltransferase family 39 protein, partial [Anaerolineae bacterium]|nr:glycosyltransferase family 39 protein [Anaerolineae bacterium]